MMIRPVMLWTDGLIFLLFALVIALAIFASGRPHLTQPWKRVAQNTQGMVSAVILMFFVAIGLLDSLHFRPQLSDEGGKPVYSVEVLSVFDVMANTMRVHTEKTYSEPFSVYSFARETAVLKDGTQVRIYPRLRYGGADLEHAGARISDILQRSLVAAVEGGLVWAVLASILVWRLSKGRRFAATAAQVFRGNSEIPWHAMLLTLLVMFLLAFPAFSLSSHYHVFGTDKVGQDVFYLALKSIRTGLVIGTLTTLVMLPFAIWLGIMAGYLGGWIDDVIQYLYTTLNSIPAVLLIAAAVLMMQVYIDTHPALFETMAERADMRLLFLCIILGMTSWTGLCRLLRGEALKLREMEYIQAAQAFGVSHFRIVIRHILPNVMHIVLISVVMEFSSLVLAEAVLSYVGVGVDPSMISFGTMINSARLEMAREPMVWWSLAAAFIFMFAMVLSANLFADAVRDAFDPRLQTRSALNLMRMFVRKDAA